MYNSRCLIIYSFPTSLLNSSWWSYPCILTLIFNKEREFNFFVRWKENHEWYAKKLFTCRTLQGKGNGTTSSSIGMLLFWLRNNMVLLREFSDRNDLEWEIYLCDIWDKVFKSGPSKICGRLPLKNWKGYGLLKQTIKVKTCTMNVFVRRKNFNPIAVGAGGKDYPLRFFV